MVVPAPPRPPTIHCFLGPEATLQILMEQVQLFSQVSGGHGDLWVLYSCYMAGHSNGKLAHLTLRTTMTYRWSSSDRGN